MGLARYKGEDGRMRLGWKLTPATVISQKSCNIKMTKKTWSRLGSRQALYKDTVTFTMVKKALFCTAIKVTLSTERIQTESGAQSNSRMLKSPKQLQNRRKENEQLSFNNISQKSSIILSKSLLLYGLKYT